MATQPHRREGALAPEGHCDVCWQRIPKGEELLGLRALDGRAGLWIVHAECWGSPRMRNLTRAERRELDRRMGRLS